MVQIPGILQESVYMLSVDINHSGRLEVFVQMGDGLRMREEVWEEEAQRVRRIIKKYNEERKTPSFGLVAAAISNEMLILDKEEPC